MYERRTRAAPPCLLALFWLLASGTATAQPYEFLAIYEPSTGSGTSKAIRLNLSANALLPDGGESHMLDRLVVRFDPDGVSLSALSLFSRLRFTTDVGGQLATVEVRTDDIAQLPNRELTLARWRGDNKENAVVAVKIALQAVYASDFLCIQERALIQGQEHTVETVADVWPVPPASGQDTATKATSSQATPSQATAPQATPSQAAAPQATPSQAAAPKDSKKEPATQEFKLRPAFRTDGGVPIIYSFCKTSNGINPSTLVNWSDAFNSNSKLYAIGDTEKIKGPDSLREAQKRALSVLLAEQLNKRFSSFGRTVITGTEEPAYDNVLVQVASTFNFSIIKSAGSLVLMEESGGNVQPLADLIDQDSEVAIALNRPVCLQLPPAALLNSPWTFEMEVPDGKEGKTRRAKADLDFRHGCNRVLLVQWKDYLNKRVTFRIIYRVPGHEDIIVFKDSFHIYNLGLITTVPVITEIISAAQKASPADIEATSSIPVSIALPMNDRERRSGTLAVTFPFTVGVNTRSFPNFAEYLALAPSVSFLGGGSTKPEDIENATSDQGPNVRVAVGMGVNVARAFHFGYAWAPSDGGRYVLIGISVPELLPLFSKGL